MESLGRIATQLSGMQSAIAVTQFVELLFSLFFALPVAFFHNAGKLFPLINVRQASYT